MGVDGFEELYSEPRADQPLGGGTWAPTGRQEQVGLQISKGGPRDAETSWHFWHPGRFGVRFGDEGIRRELQAIDPRLDVTWHPLHLRWTVWFRNPQVTFKLCPGWRLLFIVKYPDDSYMPLDERTIAEAWSRNPRAVGNGQQYWDRIVGEIRRDYKAKDKARHDDIEVRGRDQWRYAQIKNLGQGNKYSNHEVGD